MEGNQLFVLQGRVSFLYTASIQWAGLLLLLPSFLSLFCAQSSLNRVSESGGACAEKPEEGNKFITWGDFLIVSQGRAQMSPPNGVFPNRLLPHVPEVSAFWSSEFILSIIFYYITWYNINHVRANIPNTVSFSPSQRCIYKASTEHGL